MELENIILIEVTQTQKDNYHITHSQVDFKHKAKKTRLQTTIPENLDNNENTENYIGLIYMGSRKQKKTRSPE